MDLSRMAIGIGAALFVAALTSGVAQAFTRKLPSIPNPTPILANGLSAAERYIKAYPDQGVGWTLVGIEWSQRNTSGEFEPRISDGTHWAVEDAEWSWFVTYVKPGRAPTVRIVRVQQNCNVKTLSGVRI